MAGLTENGLEIRTQSELQALLEEAVGAAFPGANVRAGPLQQLIGVLSEELAIAWETLQAIYAASYPNSARGIALDQIAAITGTKRREATRSRVTALVTLAAGATLPAGSLSAVQGAPDLQFRSTQSVTNTTGGTANLSVVFESVEAGPVPAPSLSLTVIVTPVTGWLEITNVFDATLGRARAADAELRAQREVELAGGTSALDAIRSAVARVSGVLEVRVVENSALVVDGDGRPPKSFEVVVWDGPVPAAPNNFIAQALWDTKPTGIESHGGQSGDATLATGEVVAFSRATALRAYVAATIVVEPTAGAGVASQVAEAIAARGVEYRVGETAYSSQFICAALEVPGVVAVTALTLGLTNSPSGSSVVAAYDEIVLVSSGDVEVSL